MQIGALALWLAAYAARYGTIGPAQTVWSEHVVVSARVVPAATRAAHLGDGGVLAATSLSAAGPDLARWSALSARAAGTRGVTAVRIDGVDGGALPSPDAVASLTLGADPFSAATASANDVVLDIVTAPRTHWSLAGSPGLVAVRARDPLNGGAAPQSRMRSISAGGPVGRGKRTSVSFSASAASASDGPTFADLAGGIHAGAEHAHTAKAWSAGVTQSIAGLQFSTTAGAGDTRDDAAGVGGEQGPSGALNLTSQNTFIRSALTGRASSWSFRATGSFETRRDSADARSAGRGIEFAGLLIGGAPDVVSSRSQSTAFRGRVTAAASSGRWNGIVAGIDVARDAVGDTRTFNPDGMLAVTSPDAVTGVLTTRVRAAAANLTMSTAALFAERVVVDRDRVWLRGGARLTHTSNGITFDPRLTLGVNAGALLFGASAGLYTDAWPVSVQLERQFQHLPGDRIVDATGREWMAAAAGSSADRRDEVVRLGAGHAGRITVEADQTWRNAWHLAGLTRATAGSEIIDTLDHQRQRHERDTHASVSISARNWTAAAHYTFAVADDNTDGPLAFGPDPATAAPWAAAARVPRHLASLVASGGIGRGIRLLVSAEAESGSAYSLATGADPSGLLTFTGLNGLRHMYRSSGSRDLSAYLARTVAVRRSGVTADMGLRLENLFNNLSPTAIAQTSGSSRAGRAVSAGPGRSASVWATLAWR